MSKLVLEDNVVMPIGWSISDLDSLSLVITKGSTPTTYGFQYEKTGINFIKVENIVDGWIDHDTIHEFINKNTDDYLKRSQLEEQDILFSIAGTIGRTTIVRNIDLPANTNQAVAIIRCPWKYLNSKYIRLILDSPILFNSFSRKSRGVGIYNLSLSDIKELTIPIPPLNEQKKIVDKIEELMSLLDSSKKLLETIKILLKQYRQSILKSAFEGKLTKKWREDHSDELETSSSLLEKMQKIGDRKKIIKSNLISPDELHDIPDVWLWDIVSSIATVQTGPFGTQLHKSDYTNSGISVIEIGDVHPFRNLSQGSAHYVSKEKAKHLVRFAVQENDILFTRVGTVGRCTIVPADCFGWLMSTSLIRVRMLEHLFNSKFMFYYFISPTAKHFAEKTSKGTTRMGTNSKIVGNLPIIIASKKEQEQVVLKIEESFSLIENDERLIDLLLQNIEELRKSVLKQAFEGKLVPQDSTDEPAEILLEKIKQEKQKIISQTKRGKKNDK